ncbi:recombinase RecA [candidate division WOR-3 bacterium]|nr:recombinase RecA [candidate division WOR-3 bacterium]
MSKEDEKSKALVSALAQIEKQYGKGSVMRLGGEGPVAQVEAIPTGSIGLDAVLGIGGVPRGRFVEVYGPEGSGKTTLVLSIIAQCQKHGGTAAFIDAENALDSTYARALGVDLDKLLVSQPDSGEQALEIAEVLTRSGGLDLFVIDSVAALVPRAEIEGEMGDAFVGVQARLMSQAMRKLSGVAARTRTCGIFTNQIRHKIGVMFGNPETTTGGLALKFYATMRFDIRRILAIKKGEEVVGSRTRVKVVKNKVAPPFREAEFDLMYGRGISRMGELVDIGAEQGIFTKSGTWYAFGEMRIGQGRDAAIDFLAENPQVAKKAEAQLYEKLKIPKPAKPAPTADEDNRAPAAKRK